MIDLSCHFLTGPSCGPASFEESLALCRAACDNGVRTFVFTPRWKAGCAEPPLALKSCEEQIERLRAVLAPNIDLRLGFSLQFSPELPALVDRYGSALALGGQKHLLICLPANDIPTNASQVWAELKRRGFSVAISQPASRPALRRQPEILRGWVAKGLKLQMCAASVLGWHGREVRRFAHDCLERYSDSVFIASNGHAGNGDAGALKQAREELTRTFGEAQTRKWLREIPATILGKSEVSQAAPARTFAQRFSFLRTFTSW